MAQEEGKKYSQLTNITTFNDNALVAVDNHDVELNSITFGNLVDNKLRPLFATKSELANKISASNILAGNHIELSILGNDITINAIPTEDPAVLAALQYINGEEILRDDTEITAIENYGGSIELHTNYVYTITVKENVFFLPPDEVDATIQNQIEIIMHYTKFEGAATQPSVDLGQNIQMVNGLTVNFELGKTYRIFYDYDPIGEIWLCGVVMNSAIVY